MSDLLVSGSCRFVVPVTDVAGQATDAVDLAAVLAQPDGTTVSLTPVHDGTGIYHVDVSPTQPGMHEVHVTSAVLHFAYGRVFHVYPLTGSYGLLSLEDVKDQVNVDQADTTHDAELQRINRAAAAAIELRAGAVVPTDYTDTFWGATYDTLSVAYQLLGRDLRLRTRPVMSVASVVIDGDTIDPSFYTLDKQAGIVHHNSAAWIGHQVVVNYRAGRTIVADNILEACRIIVHDMWETQFAQTQIGVEVGTPNPYLMPRRARELLSSRVIFA